MAETVRSGEDKWVTFTLRPIAGTANHLVQRRNSDGLIEFVAEIVRYPEGYTLYRMDATGVLASELSDPESALEFYDRWVRETNPHIQGVME
jgi:hypothetical protein